MLSRLCFIDLKRATPSGVWSHNLVILACMLWITCAWMEDRDLKVSGMETPMTLFGNIKVLLLSVCWVATTVTVGMTVVSWVSRAPVVPLLSSSTSAK